MEIATSLRVALWRLERRGSLLVRNAVELAGLVHRESLLMRARRLLYCMDSVLVDTHARPAIVWMLNGL
jgi:hypothetical protein